MKYSAFEVSKRVFYEHYEKKGTAEGQRGRIEELFDGEMKADAKHGIKFDYRPSIDLMFLAALDNEARKAGDTQLATKVQNLVESTVDKFYTKMFTESLPEKTTWGNAGNIFYPIKAMVFIKFFMNGSKKGTPMMKKVDEIRMKCIRRSMELYKTSIWKGQQVGTIQEIVKAKKPFTPTSGSGNIQAATVLNAVSQLSGPLALNSYLVGNQLESFTVPTDYSLREDIADMGNYLYEMCFGNATRRQCNYGGVPDTINRAEYVISGYSAWVAGGLAQTGHGTVYPNNFWERPASAFLTRVPQFFKGFQDCFNVFGFLPDTTRAFGEDKWHTTQKDHILYPPDTTPYMYTLAYYGDQSMIDWIDYKTMRNGLKDPARKFADNGIDIVPGEAIIEAVIRRDLKDPTLRAKTGQAFTTRGIEGLAAGMFKRLSFND